MIESHGLRDGLHASDGWPSPRRVLQVESAQVDGHVRWAYVTLLDEGVPTIKKVALQQVGKGRYLVLKPSRYDPEDEVWEFVAGTVVSLVSHKSWDGSYLELAAAANDAED